MIAHDFDLIRVAALTHRGALRDRNEDAVALGRRILHGDMESPAVDEIDDNMRMLIVADGMGGHARGELASRAVLEAILDRELPQDILASREAILTANDRLYDLMRMRPEVLGLGSTVVGVTFCVDSLIHFNVGDSRAYRHRRGVLDLVSHDDVPGRSRAPGSRRTTQEITQSLGGHFSRTRVVPHVGSSLPLRRGESILLCSDGLTDMIDDPSITRILDAAEEPANSVRRLVGAAIDAGGHDNISVVIAAAQ